MAFYYVHFFWGFGLLPKSSTHYPTVDKNSAEYIAYIEFKEIMNDENNLEEVHTDENGHTRVKLKDESLYVSPPKDSYVKVVFQIPGQEEEAIGFSVFDWPDANLNDEKTRDEIAQRCLNRLTYNNPPEEYTYYFTSFEEDEK